MDPPLKIHGAVTLQPSPLNTDFKNSADGSNKTSSLQQTQRTKPAPVLKKKPTKAHLLSNPSHSFDSRERSHHQDYMNMQNRTDPSEELRRERARKGIPWDSAHMASTTGAIGTTAHHGRKAHGPIPVSNTRLNDDLVFPSGTKPKGHPEQSPSLRYFQGDSPGSSSADSVSPRADRADRRRSRHRERKFRI